MGWPEETTLDSSMQYIETAYRGRVKMFQTIGLIGTANAEPDRPAEDVTQNLTPLLFDSLFSGGGELI
jgi:hypothetical protein